MNPEKNLTRKTIRMIAGVTGAAALLLLPLGTRHLWAQHLYR